MAKVECVLLDITGVLKEGDAPIQGSVEAVKKLRETGLKICFVTNETQESKKSLVAKLRRMGFELEEAEVVAPCPAMLHELKTKGLRPHLLIHPNVECEFSEVSKESPDCVVVGDCAEHFTYANMNLAFRALMAMQTPLLYSLGRGRYFKEDGQLVLDVGSFAACLEFATGAKATVVGKPEPAFFRTALQMLGVQPENAIMVGDDVVSDVGGAQECGLRGILVRTGKYRPQDENHPVVKPFHIADNLHAAVNFILSL